MDFPNKSFPYQLFERVSKKTPDGYKQTSMREPFISYGSHGNIDVEDIVEKSFCPQKIPEGFLQSKNIWKTKRPTLPLYDKPEIVSYPLVDCVTDPLIEERYEIRKLLDNLKCHRSLARTKTFDSGGRKHKHRFFKEMKEELEKLQDDDSANYHHEAFKIKKHLPKSYRYLVDLYDKYKSTKEIMRVNSSYTDGCLGYLPCDDPKSTTGGSLVTPCEDFTKLQISNVIGGDQENIQVEGTQLIECKEKVLGVTASRIRGKGFVISRHSTMCTRHNVNDGESDELQITDGCPTSQALSPYTPGECLVATSSGTVYLWSLDRSEEVVKTKEHRFYCRDQWRQAIFGSHPRQIVHADNSVVELFDLRKKTHNGTDLFALPSKFLDQYERIRIIKQHSPFLCIIACDYSMFVVDERFPGHPLLQWNHTLKNPPQYLDVMTGLGAEGQSLILVASQNPMEAFCYLLQGGKQTPLQGLGSPWMISRVHDFTLWDEICHGSEKVVVDNRYSKDSLLGICSMPYKDGFITYQLDSHCDIFYQVYHHTDKGDKSYTGGPGMNSLLLDDYTKEKGRAWVQAVNSDVDEQKSVEDPFRFAQEYDASPYFDEIILTKPYHVLCPLCNGEDGAKESSPEDLETMCHCCSQNLRIGSMITTNAKQDKVCSIACNELKHLPLVSELSTDVLSQMITRLWNDEPVTDLLASRDEEVKKKLDKIKEVKKKHAASKKNSEIDSSELPPSLRKLIGSSSKSKRLPSREVESDYSGSGSDTNEKQMRKTSLSLSEGDTNEKPTREATPSVNEDGHEILKTSEKSDVLKSNIGISNENTQKSGVDTENDGQQYSLSEPFVTSYSRKRQRHSSISSVSSLGSAMSTSSDTLPGFMRTPTRKFLSPRSQSVKDDASENDLFEEDFLSPESRQSFQMFSQQKTFLQSSNCQSCESPSKRQKSHMDTSAGSPWRSQQTLAFSSPKKVKLKKKYVSGF